MKKDILFLLSGRDVPSSRFRVLVYLPYLEEMDWGYTVIPGGTGLLKKMRILKIAPDYKLIFIQKKILSGLFLRLLCRRNPRLIFDFDDALFSRESSGKPWSLKKPGTPYTKYRLHQIFKKAEHVIAGNKFLADYAIPFSRKVSIVPTPVNPPDYSIEEKNKNRIVIGWIGTGRNLVYLREIEKVLETIAERFPRVEYRIISDKIYTLDKAAIRNISWRESTALKELSRFDIGLMPLFDDPWSRGKCAFKVLQYMTAGIPPVASPVGMNSEIIDEGVTGYLAANDREWMDALTLLIENADLRKEIGQNGRRFVEENYTIGICWEKFRQILEKHL